MGTDANDLFVIASDLLDDPVAYQRMAGAVNPFGDGRAAERVLSELARDCSRPEAVPATIIESLHPPGEEMIPVDGFEHGVR